MVENGVFVCGINYRTSSASLKEFLSLFGYIKSCGVVPSGYYKCAFVKFHDIYAVPMLLELGMIYFEGGWIRFGPLLSKSEGRKRRSHCVVDRNQQQQSNTITRQPLPRFLWNIVTTGYHGFNTVDTFYNTGQVWVQTLEQHIRYH